MKKYVLVSVAFMVFATTVFAYRWYDTKTKPAISMVDAVKTATFRLNLRGGDFYCLGASAKMMNGATVWELQFSSTAGAIVYVGMDGKGTMTTSSEPPFH